MNELPSQQEMILRAHYYDELPRDEIAKELMCTQSNVGQQEQAALAALYRARFQNGLNEYLSKTPIMPCGSGSGGLNPQGPAL